MADDPLEAARSDPRVLYAAERTFLAWIRTGLALMGFGFVVARFGLFLRGLAANNAQTQPMKHGLSLWVGIVLVVMGVLTHFAAAWRHREIVRRLRPAYPSDLAWSRGSVWMAVALGAVGAFLAGYLVYAR